MPGHKRRLVVGENVMLVYVEREAGTTQEHAHENEQLVYIQMGKALFTIDERAKRSGRAEYSIFLQGSLTASRPTPPSLILVSKPPSEKM